MLNDLEVLDDLGTPSFFYLLSTELFKRKDYYRSKGILEIFSNKSINGQTEFYDALEFAKKINLIEETLEGFVNFNNLFEKELSTEEILSSLIIEQIFFTLDVKDELDVIFNPKYISFDVVYNNIEIKNSAFGFKYSNFKQLLLDFNFIYPHPNNNGYIVCDAYANKFDKWVLPILKRKKLTLESLEEQLERQKKYGEEAELFVLEFERNRLSSHPRIDDIKKISDYDVAAGYDIVSFNNNESKKFDRFIEVKSFERKEKFYWSKNEVKEALIRKNDYYLYLIDRSKIKNGSYSPLIIQNPYDNVLNNDEWNKETDTYIITKV